MGGGGKKDLKIKARREENSRTVKKEKG